MNGCLTLVPNSLTRARAYFRGVPVYIENLTTYLKLLRELGFQYFGTRADSLLQTIGSESVSFMKNAGIGFKMIIVKNKGVIRWGNSDLFTELGEQLCRGTDEELGSFLFFYRMSKSDKRARIASYIMDLQDRALYLFDEAAAKELTGLDIPASANGLSPDFSTVPEALYQGNVEQSITKIKLTGVYDNDFALATKQAGIDKKVEDLVDYVWHHLDDFDPVTGECTMQLVRKDLHGKLFTGTTHTGGVKLWCLFYGFAKYY